MKRVVVAGATGYLGRYLVSEFTRRGIAVRAIVRPGKTVEGADEVVEAEVTQAGSLRGVCDGADAVFSALGITRQTDKVTYEDVEYTANKQLLDEALLAGVQQFGVISAVNPAAFSGLSILASRERFIAELQAAPIFSSVVRATGFFCDMKEVFEMAAKGRVWLLGDGSTEANPIHGADLASACAEAMLGDVAEVSVGGPDTMTWNAIAQVAFEALDRKPQVTHLPTWLPSLLLPLVRVFNRRAFDVGSFIAKGATLNTVAPATGSESLRSFYEELALAHSS
ncbi:MAG: hypothetical protein ACI9KE_006095 [Polyangiales bacterium]|jgi:uncharacterized protein YbjT (DUF2867 family)